jgi:hypothetical protein
MYVPVRRFGAVVLGVLTVLGPLSLQAHAQRVPVGAVPNPGLNPNPYVNPAAGLDRFATASAINAAGGPFGTGLGFPGLGSGALAASYANPALGYGSLLNGAGTGYGGFGQAGGWGWGTQWMMNPYEGYLSGAASVTTANAQYQLTIQQAKLLRQEYIRSTLQTRRAVIEEYEYERAHWPDPEKIRQDEIRRELETARFSPPLNDVWSGRSLNTLLRHLIEQQGRGAKGPAIPLSEDTLKSINLTGGDTRGNIGLLKDKGALQWPQPLQGEAFKAVREDFNRRLKDAAQTVSLGNNPEPSTISDLDADVHRLNEMLDASIGALSPDEYTDASRYVRLLRDTVTALKDPKVANYFNGRWSAKAKDVATLVKYMAEQGLRFAPATPKDEPAYLALYHALAAFDAGMPPVASSGSSDNDANK